jgi:signal transduction histidine kinase/HPt (histidine-containing phosphotransfer) domain-containing protein/ActR/RegA family two-component response regulator
MMPALTTELFQLLGYALCEDRSGGKFVLLYDPPDWFRAIWGSQSASGDLLALADRSPFLEAFLSEAEEHWNSNAETPLASGAWVESDSARHEIPLEARAWRLDGKRILSIQSPREEFEKQRHTLQTARDSLLVHERLLKEIQSKEILLHCIIHDLSQPLTAMRGCFDILARETATPGSKRMVELGRQQSERQDGMIREILQAFAADINSAIGVGDAAQSASSILACADETVTAFAPVFESHGAVIRLDPRVDRNARWSVAGDSSRLMRIFSNLVENALRHAPKESVVTIRLEDDGGCVRASVDDEGPGLPKEFKPAEAFALFSKGEQGGGKAGLGLYFCRITVERWGGTIGCESLPNCGARFWFRLPRAAGTDQAIESLRSSEETVSSRQAPLKILLAEDDPAVRELTGILLERENEKHEVVAVASGLEALRAIAKQRFDVVILDEEMPGMSGVEVTKTIRDRETQDGKHQIIFALTGNASEEDHTRLLAAGFDVCLAKPFRAEELRQAIARFSFGATVAPTKRNSLPVAAIGDSSLLARLGGDKRLLQSIVQTFLKDRPAKIRKIKKALASKDAPALASAAHALRGAVAIFGAADAVKSALALEQMGRQDELAMSTAVFGNLDKAIGRLEAKLREYAPPTKRTSSKPRPAKNPARKSRQRAKWRSRRR